MTIIHIVLFKLSASLDTAGEGQFCDDMVSLRHKCIRPGTDKTYIISSSGGKDNSPEGAQNDFTHGFVVEFASKGDRDYYVDNDPAHKAFKDSIDGKFEDVTVVDYEVGVF